MNNSIIFRRDRHGVLLRYPIDVRLPAQPRNPATDRERIALIYAERELLALWIIAEHLDISDIAKVRIGDALNMISEALQLKRRDYGMCHGRR